MDIKLLSKSAKPLSTFFCSVALGFTFLSTSSYAQQSLCDATQTSGQEIALLDQACPIGKGLWGKQQPKGNDSSFWIQCGVLAKPLSSSEVQLIHQEITSDVWGKIEGRNARCLIGPYHDFSQASQDLIKVKTLKPYKQAFIREVMKEPSLAQSGAKTIAIQHVAAPVTEAKIPSKKKQSTTVIPAAKPVTKPAPPAEVVAPKPIETQISIRRDAMIDGTQYKVPYMIFGEEQFYMEYDLPWNRLNYEGAATLCKQLGMQLPNDEQWQKLLNENVMSSEKWPMHLPYWGVDRTGLFTSGKTNQINGTSLLNVMCVK